MHLIKLSLVTLNTLVLISFFSAAQACPNANKTSNGFSNAIFSVADQTIKDSSGNTIGTVDSNGNFRDANGNSTGSVDSNSNFKDSKGNSTGSIDSNGNVRNANGNSAGSVSDH